MFTQPFHVPMKFHAMAPDKPEGALSGRMRRYQVQQRQELAKAGLYD
jgi:hypothetical protein